MNSEIKDELRLEIEKLWVSSSQLQWEEKYIVQLKEKDRKLRSSIVSKLGDHHILYRGYVYSINTHRLGNLKVLPIKSIDIKYDKTDVHCYSDEEK